MSMNYQKLIIAGNATSDPEVKQAKQGDVTYTRLQVAVGGTKDRTFFPVTVFGKLGELVAQYVTKGRQVLVEGRVSLSEKGYFGVIADKVVFGVGKRTTSNDETDTSDVEIDANEISV